MAETVYVRAGRAEIAQALAAITHVGHGTSAEVNVLAEAMMTRCGLVLLGRIKRAFVVKSCGGVDEAGDSWQPLSPKTIAYSRRGRTGTERKRAAQGHSLPSVALSAKQRDRWWSLYSRGLAMYRGDKGHAAARAWVILKAEGAETLLMKYGGRKVDILRDTGLLLNSLSPGVASPEQVFEVGRGEVTVGTNRVGAAAHHSGIPGRLPQRRLWAPPDQWPATWWQDLLEQAKAGLVEIAIVLIKRGGGA